MTTNLKFYTEDQIKKIVIRFQKLQETTLRTLSDKDADNVWENIKGGFVDKGGVYPAEWVLEFVRQLLTFPMFVERHVTQGHHADPAEYIFNYFKPRVNGIYTKVNGSAEDPFFEEAGPIDPFAFAKLERRRAAGNTPEDILAMGWRMVVKETPLKVCPCCSAYLTESGECGSCDFHAGKGKFGGAFRKVMDKRAAVLNNLSTYCHNASKNAGWYHDRNTGKRLRDNLAEKLCLIHSEISEALEGVRKNENDKHLPTRKAEEVELVDALIRIFDYAGLRGLDLGGALVEKMEYNASEAGKENRKNKSF